MVLDNVFVTCYMKDPHRERCGIKFSIYYSLSPVLHFRTGDIRRKKSARSVGENGNIGPRDLILKAWT